MIKSPQPVDDDVVDLVDDDVDIVDCEPAPQPELQAQAKAARVRAPQGLSGVLVLASAFFLIFFAYSAAQNLQTSLEGMTGYVSLGVIYVVFAISSLFVPSLIATIGEKRVLIIGGALYVPFLFVNAHPVMWLMVPASFLTCIGAGCIWAAQGSALVKLAGTGERLGLASGIFFVIYQANGVLGNLFTGIFLGSGHDLAVFITFGVMGILGTLLFLPLRVPTNKELAAQKQGSPREAPSDEEKGPTMAQKLASSFRIIFSKRMLWMVVPLVFSGTTTALFMGKFPAIIGTPKLSYVMALLAAVDAVSSFFCGKLSDRAGRIPVLLFGWFALNTSNFLTARAASFIRDDSGLGLGAAGIDKLEHRIPPNAMAMLWVAAIGYGFYDSTIQTQLYSIFGLVFPDNPAAGFGGLLTLLHWL